MAAFARIFNDRGFARSCGCISMPQGSKKSGDRCLGRSRGGLSTKIHARRPPSPADPDPDHLAARSLRRQAFSWPTSAKTPSLSPTRPTTPIACEPISRHAATANIPNTIRRKKRFRWTKALYRERTPVERFFNQLKQFRRIATRYPVFIQIAAVPISVLI